MARGEGVKKLGDLFAKYAQTLKAPQTSVIAVFCEVVADVVSVPLKPSQAGYSPFTRVISLKAPGALKSEILLNKAEVLLHLKGRLGEKSAPLDII